MKHGGNLDAARRQFGDHPDGWIDLSTGINPVAYPFVVPELEHWQSLPQADYGARLIEAARSAYHVPESTDVVAAPGTQILIQLVARLRAEARVAIVEPTYSEHEIAWRLEGATVRGISKPSDVIARDDNVLVVVNPNNPDMRVWSLDELGRVASVLEAREGLLVVDEAFCDVTPELSVLPHLDGGSCVVLRSFGKFYGLAGVRLGFAMGHAREISRIRDWLGPWAVSGPALHIGAEALLDDAWAAETRARVADDSARLRECLVKAGFVVADAFSRPSLFVQAFHARAPDIAERLAQRGILVRTFDWAPDMLRFGLPHPNAFARFEGALGSAASI